MESTSSRRHGSVGRWRLLWLIIAVSFGTFSTIGVQWFSDTKRPGADGAPDLIPVSLGNIAPKDQWITCFDVYVAPVHRIRTSSVYLMMVVVPKPKLDRDSLIAAMDRGLKSDDGLVNFELTGFSASGEVKPVLIDPRYFLKNPNRPAILTLDFIGDSVSIPPSGLLLNSRKN